MSQKSNRIAVAAAIVAVIGAVVAGVTLSKPAAQLDPATPQGVVQGFLKATLARDVTAALTYLDPASGCTVRSFDNAYYPDNPEVTLVRTSATTDSATVEIRVGTPGGGIIGGGSETHTYRLTRSTGAWRIASVPWPLYDCGLVK